MTHYHSLKQMAIFDLIACSFRLELARAYRTNNNNKQPSPLFPQWLHLPDGFTTSRLPEKIKKRLQKSGISPKSPADL
jgi:hypothetical protein